MPDGWSWYKFSVRDDEVQLSGLRYIEDYLWTGAETVTDRLNHIINSFMTYLQAKDKSAMKAIMILIGD